MRTDAELWASAVAGDAEAFGAIFDRHASIVYAYLRRRTSSRESAEDLLSSTFLEAWRLPDRVRMLNGCALPWLYGVATNLLRNERRTLWRYRRALGRVVPTGLEEEIDPAEVVVERDELQRQRELLAELSMCDREVILLRNFAQLSYAEIAVALDLPVGTVRSRLARARSRSDRLVKSRDELALSRHSVNGGENECV